MKTIWCRNPLLSLRVLAKFLSMPIHPEECGGNRREAKVCLASRNISLLFCLWGRGRNWAALKWKIRCGKWQETVWRKYRDTCGQDVFKNWRLAQQRGFPACWSKCERLVALIRACFTYPVLDQKWAFHLSCRLQNPGCCSAIRLTEFYLPNCRQSLSKKMYWPD